MKLLARSIAMLGLAVVCLSCTPAVRYSPHEIMQFSPEVQEHIKRREVALGMTQPAVRYAWGAPFAVKLESDALGKPVEVWSYTELRVLITKLYFTDGKLTATASGSILRKPTSPLAQKEGDKNSPAEGGTAEGTKADTTPKGTER